MPLQSVETSLTGREVRSNGYSSKGGYRVGLVEAQLDVRENWANLINSFHDFTCICACSSAHDALRLLPGEYPDIVLMDILPHGVSGVECIMRLKALLPQTQIIILTALNDQNFVFLALEAGADGYLLKRTTPSDLRAALLDVLSGGAPMTNEIARLVIESFRKKNKPQDEVGRLTAREEQIIKLLSQGYTNRRISEMLELSIDTVCCHLKHVFKKLHVSSRTEAVVCYLTLKQEGRTGLCSASD